MHVRTYKISLWATTIAVSFIHTFSRLHPIPPTLPLITRLLERIRMLRMRTVRSSSFVQSREKKKKKKIQNSRVYPTSFDKRRSDTCSFVFGELVESPRVKYLDTNIYIYVCVKKDPRNNFPKSTFRIIENDRYSTISR